MPRLALAVPLLAAALQFAGIQPAAAGSLSQEVTGNRLDLRLACATKVEIRPRADLAGKVEVTATSDTSGVLDALRFTSGDAATINYHGHCWLHDDRALELSIEAPPGFALDIDQEGAGDYDIGAMGGPLKLAISGAGEFRVEQISSLDLHVAGAAEIDVRRLEGPGKVFQGGGGDITIGGGKMPKLHLDLNGASNVEIEGGEIGALDVALNGAGNAEIHAPVGDANLRIAGIGRIQVDKVTGNVHRDVAGLGVIDIGD
jgi:hypothetical protein